MKRARSFSNWAIFFLNRGWGGCMTKTEAEMSDVQMCELIRMERGLKQLQPTKLDLLIVIKAAI